MKNYKTHLITLLLISFYNFGVTQTADERLTKAEKLETVNSVGNILIENYVFLEVANKIKKLLSDKLKNGQYDTINSPNKFAQVLTRDAQSFNHDQHLRVGFFPQYIAELKEMVSTEDSINFQKKEINRKRKSNFGFDEIKILKGNIGYLNLKGFEDPAYASETAISAMNFLSNSDAIIIDLRENGGGWPEMVQLITSYFFDSKPVHLNSLYYRNKNKTIQYWTLPYVTGKRMPDVPLYVLTSSAETFSAAEEFCYNLQNLNRATIIGEKTDGGAHHDKIIPATDKFTLKTPFGRAINPITKTNWEGIGIMPDVKTSSQNALIVARIMAFDQLIKVSKDEEMKRLYSWDLTDLKAEKDPLKISLSTLKTYVGSYASGVRVISLENNNLYYQREGSTKYKLIPLNDNIFKREGLNGFRIKFINDNNKVIGLQGLYESGRIDESPKDK